MYEATGNNADGASTRPTGREEVIDAAVRAAADLFVERNPNQVSVREIAARAGVSHALVHRYMGSKDDIYCAALALLRDQAAEYWTESHGMQETTNTFAATLPPGRYVRMAMRGALEGDMPISPVDVKLPHSDRMLSVLVSDEIHVSDDAPFDPRVILAATTAMAAAFVVAEPFFLAQGGLENEDPEFVHGEFQRLITKMMSLADTSAGAHR